MTLFLKVKTIFLFNNKRAEIIDERMSHLAATEEGDLGEIIKYSDLTSTNNQYSTQFTEGKKPDIQELETIIIQLREEIEKRKIFEVVSETFFKNTISPIAILDRNYNFVRVNDAYAKVYSRKVSGFPGHNHFHFYPYPSDAKEIFDNVVKTKETYKALATPFTYPDYPEWGLTYWDWTIAPALDSSGEVELLILTLNDVTDYIRVQERLRESEERYRSIFHNSLDGIILNLPDGTILSANPSACRIFGRTEEELCSVGRNGIVDFDDPRVMRAVQEREKTGSFNSEMTFVHKDGTKFPVEVTSTQFKDKNCLILSSMIVRDISERKKSENALRLSEEKFAKAFYQNPTMMCISRIEDGVYIDVNDTWADTFGYNREEMIGKSAFELNVWADSKDRQKMVNQLAENAYIKKFESKYRKKSGEIGFPIAAISILDINGEKCMLISAIDITEQKRAEEALRLSEKLFYKVFCTNPLSMAIVTSEPWKYVEVNDAFIKRYGYSRDKLIGSSLTDIGIWADINERYNFVQQIKQKGFANNFEVKFRKKTGELLTVLMSGVAINFHGEECTLGISSDITELRRYQHEIARLDRLNLVGEMSAGIGHEIRNPMTTVRGFLQLLSGKDRYAQDKEYMDLMIEELDRANSIITEFLSLAKNKAVELKRQSLNKIINNLFPLLQANALKQDKSIDMELGVIPYIIIDKNEIHQLILNLVRNGLEAMSPGGFMTIKTFKEGDKVVLAVQDQGEGITTEVLEKIGTPFFTTKDNGTGLGLAVCYSIAQRNNAKIDIETGSNGTTFYVRFKA